MLNKLKFLSYFHEWFDKLCFWLGHKLDLHFHQYLFLLLKAWSFSSIIFPELCLSLSYNNFYKDNFHLNIANIDPWYI